MTLQVKDLAIILLLLLLAAGCQTTEQYDSGPESVQVQGEKFQKTPAFIDVHNHLYIGRRGDLSEYLSAASNALTKMEQLGITKMILMPPPRSKDNRGTFVMDDLLPVIKKYPGSFYLLGGGGSLNLIIQGATVGENGKVSSSVQNRFKRKALEILEKGAIGFGEFAVEHFSFNSDHPYESVAADHPLFLILADIAAEHGVPIDIHMEAIPERMPLPTRKVLNRSGRNPEILQENIYSFERLLAHNRAAKIIWAHAGWCNTGARTVELCRRLLQKHPNLYMSFKLSPESVPENRPIGMEKNSIKPEWLALIREFPDRFMIGTDQFYGPPGERGIGPQKTEATRRFVSLLPEDLAVKVGLDNPQRIFGLE